ncbi:hypothetical protein IFR05_007548 [Cadophora sp. M221]|nr:hypothetical protein IFR05_007548 [Cadophora sp. M221]
MGCGQSAPKESKPSQGRNGSSPVRANPEPPRRKLSLGTLRKEYAQHEERPSFQERYAGVIAYIQRLEEDRQKSENQLQRSKIDLERVDNVFSNVSRSVVNWKPYDRSARREPPEPHRVPEYIQMLQGKFDDQCSHSSRMATNIAELQAQIEKLRGDVDTKTTEIVRLREKNVQDAKTHGIKIAQNNSNHDLEITRIENSHLNALQGLEKTHSAKIQKMQRQFDDASRTARDEHNVEKSRLQNALLTTVDGFKPMVDKVCRDQLEDLRGSIHGLVFSLDDLERGDPGPLRSQIAKIRNPQNKDYKNVLEGCFWSIIFRGMFATPFCSLGEYGDAFMDTWIGLFGKGKSYQWPEADTRSETWRYVTLETLEQDLKSSRPSNLKSSYEANRQSVISSLSNLYSQVSPENKSREIRDIVDKACHLALAFGKQRCRLQVLAPQPGDPIDARDTAACFILNHSSDRVIPEVQLVMKPGLLKVGDSRGGSLGSSANMSPSAVYLKIAAN